MSSAETPPPNQINKVQVSPFTGLPNTYFNGFETYFTETDVIIRLLINGSPTHILNCSHTTAKSFIEELSHIVTSFEKSHNVKIPTINEIRKKAQQLDNKQLKQ